ncbi:MAG: 50S ribosomal protein L11 methyltransferase [Saprospiraceae bacterium]|nr:50S ribosomal protein L11 methyltransferase [Saprospiraceae bacterium]
MATYKAYIINSTEEALLGLLSEYPFESFEETDEQLIGYIPETQLTDQISKEINEIIHKFSADYQVETIEPQNWNEIWEASFQPVIVEDFCIVRADFHPTDEDIQHDLIINPKMAFGTGHHATTYMMIRKMADLDFSGKSVFDFGCGTGILAILASKLGAEKIDAIDIETESYQNTIENSAQNHVHNVTAYLGSLEDISPKKYDIILANINRNILVRYVDDLKDRMHTDSYLLVSGVLVEDKEILEKAFKAKGFVSVSDLQKDNWICILMKLNS